jgi:hypothetical protein
VPRFPHRSSCDSWSSSCPAIVDQQFLTAFASSSSSTVGFIPNLNDDYTKLAILLGTSLPVCDSIGVNAPDGNPDYPVNATIFAKKTTTFGDIILTTPPFYPDTINVTYNVAQCQLFNSSIIIATAPLYQPDGTRRTDTPSSYCKGIIPENTSIYVPAGSSLGLLNDKIREFHWLFGLMPTDKDCNKGTTYFATLTLLLS